MNDELEDHDGQPEPADRPSEDTPGDTPGGFLQLVGQATSLGWNMVVPIVGGVLLGRYLDDRFDKEFTWTLSLLLMGVFVAFNNLYAMYIEHGGAGPLVRRNRRKKSETNGYHAEDQ